MTRLLLIWLALGVVLTSATQLRLPGLPIGPGELLLAWWLTVATVHLLFNPNFIVSPTPTLIYVSLFWLLATALAASGAMVTQTMGYPVDFAAVHDSIALAFTAVFSIVVVCWLQKENLALRFSKYLTAATAIACLLLLLGAFTIRTLGPMNFWFAELRFTGWATNPNQMALLLSFVPFLALDCAKHDARLHAQFGWFLCAATIGIAGIVSASDALALAWLAGLSLCGATLWWRSVFGNQASVRSVLLLALVLPLVTLVWLIPYIAPLLPTVTDAALDVYDTGSQGATRIRVWGYGISAALDSPFIGLGPGPHSGYWGPHQGLEAHNTLIDWTSITGIFGTVAFLALIGCAFRRSISSQRLWISAGVVTITVFCMFHYTVRQPLFWTYLIIALLSNNFSISARTPTTHTVCR